MSEEESVIEDPEVMNLVKQLDKLAADNIKIEEDLIRQGVRPDPLVIISMRLNLLLDVLMGEGVGRINYELESQRQIRGILMHIQQQKLNESKLIIPTLGQV